MSAGRPQTSRPRHSAVADTEYVRLALLCERAGHVLGLALDSQAPHRLTLRVTRGDRRARLSAPFDPVRPGLAAVRLRDALVEGS